MMTPSMFQFMWRNWSKFQKQRSVGNNFRIPILKYQCSRKIYVNYVCICSSTWSYASLGFNFLSIYLSIYHRTLSNRIFYFPVFKIHLISYFQVLIPFLKNIQKLFLGFSLTDIKKFSHIHGKSKQRKKKIEKLMGIR